jgi:ketosteroid isomerase-like protein
MITTETMSQIEMNKVVIQRYFEAYDNKDEAIFDEIIAPEYVDHGQSAYMGPPRIGVAGAKHDLLPILLSKKTNQISSSILLLLLFD